MVDKYSKIEEEVRKNKDRVDVLGVLVEKFFSEIKNFFEYEITNVREDDFGRRVNFVRFTCKRSLARFVIIQKKEDFQKEFEIIQKEKLVVVVV